MGYAQAAWERAMKIQEEIVRALSAKFTLSSRGDPGVSTRTMRRCRWGTGEVG